MLGVGLVEYRLPIPADFVGAAGMNLLGREQPVTCPQETRPFIRRVCSCMFEEQ